MSLMNRTARREQSVIAGIDEAGRGCLAGPVVAAACIFDRKAFKGKRIPRIADSKQMTAAEREKAYEFLIAHVPYGVGMADASIVDAIGILGATEKAMQDAVLELSKTITPTYLLIDGRDRFWFDIPHSSIIHGDQKEACISAASVLAKVTRDRLMKGFEGAFPEYGFTDHKGYGTPFHLEILKRKGPCPLHRRSFLRNLGGTQAPSGFLRVEA